MAAKYGIRRVFHIPLRVVAGLFGQVLLLYGFVFALYFILNFGISLIVRAYQRRLKEARAG